MIRHSVVMFSAAVVGITCVTALTHASQVRRRQGPVLVAIEVSLKVGSASYVTKGLGSCTHAPKASIYDVPAQLWSVQQASGERPVRLTLWKPSDGLSSMFSLSVNDPVRSITISTVRGGEVTGSGTVTLAAAAQGGTFTVDAKTKTGESIAGTIKCEAFTPHAADGGN
jgi:hypothetical protein